MFTKTPEEEKIRAAQKLNSEGVSQQTVTPVTSAAPVAVPALSQALASVKEKGKEKELPLEDRFEHFKKLQAELQHAHEEYERESLNPFIYPRVLSEYSSRLYKARGAYDKEEKRLEKQGIQIPPWQPRTENEKKELEERAATYAKQQEEKALTPSAPEGAENIIGGYTASSSSSGYNPPAPESGPAPQDYEQPYMMPQMQYVPIPMEQLQGPNINPMQLMELIQQHQSPNVQYVNAKPKHSIFQKIMGEFEKEKPYKPFRYPGV